MNLALEGVIKVTFRILDPDVMGFRHDPFVGIAIFYLALKSQMLNRCRVVKWLTVVQQPNLEFSKYTGFEYILIISEHQSTNFVSLSSWICAWKSCPVLEIPYCSNASLCEVSLILLNTPWIWVYLIWCTWCGMGQKNGSSWQCCTCKRWALQVVYYLLVADGMLKIFAE